MYHNLDINMYQYIGCINTGLSTPPPHLDAVPLYMCVHVGSHLRLLIGCVVARAAVQREGVLLPLAVFCHVTLKEGMTLGLKAAHMAPRGGGGGGGRGWRCTGKNGSCGNSVCLCMCVCLPEEVGVTCVLVSAGAAVSFYQRN